MRVLSEAFTAEEKPAARSIRLYRHPKSTPPLPFRRRMKLTAELINNSPTYINAIKDRELDLSRNHIPMLENLGATRDLNDSLNLCTNSIRILGNFPTLPRLRNLYLADNRIASIERGLEQFVPNLETLVLTNNEIKELVDLEPLRGLGSLHTLSLANNPVMRKANARLWCVWRLPQTLRVLDFERVKESERQQARELFGAQDGGLSGLARSILAIESTEPKNTFEPGEGLATENEGDSEEKASEDAQKEQNIADLKARIRDEMAQVEAMEEFI
ncbi:L domain-like protein [Martensiomyces pterosporus]|nr:L domain-like protein [Martensiomyces pterosporus]